MIPVWTDLRVFAGHGPETLHNAEKLVALQQFFDPDTDDAWKQSLLVDYDLGYVFYGPDERALGGWEPDTAVYLTPIHRNQEYAIYGVSQTGR